VRLPLMNASFIVDHACRNCRASTESSSACTPSRSLHIISLISTPIGQESVAVFGLDPLQLIAGSLPVRQQRLVEAWGELHHGELVQDWHLLQRGQRPQPIAPLQ
jgi:hypothetical protein